MKKLRKSADRGYADHGWLKSFHSFSFAGYHDAQHMSFGPLRVVNEDRITKGSGFGTHGHKDMEIISYVLEGAVAHKDSMGNGSTIKPGDVQRMSAGTGVMHSEFNANDKGDTHFLQIWIVPDKNSIAPGYEEKHFSVEQKRGQLRLIGSDDGRDGSVKVQQDIALYAGLFNGSETAALSIAPGRVVYVHAARGSAKVAGVTLTSGDALMVTDESLLEISSGNDAEILVFDMAA